MTRRSDVVSKNIHAATEDGEGQRGGRPAKQRAGWRQSGFRRWGNRGCVRCYPESLTVHILLDVRIDNLCRYRKSIDITVIRLPMPPDGDTTITVNEDVFSLLINVMDEYDCESVADEVETPSIIALDYDEAELAQLLADRLEE